MRHPLPIALLVMGTLLLQPAAVARMAPATPAPAAATGVEQAMPCHEGAAESAPTMPCCADASCHCDALCGGAAVGLPAASTCTPPAQHTVFAPFTLPMLAAHSIEALRPPIALCD